MTRSALRLTRPSLVLAILAILLSTSLLPSAPAIAAPGIAASPSAIDETLPLGSSTPIAISLHNDTSASIAPHIFTAQPAPATLAAASSVTGPTQVELPQQASPLDQQLLTDLASPNAHEKFLVYLRDQADLSASYAITDWAERGRYVYRTLTTHAEQSQRDVRQQLAARGVSFTPFWIVNALLVDGTLADARALVMRADVALVRAERTTALDPGAAPLASALGHSCNPGDPDNQTCWNIKAIGADRVWNDFGVTGQGIVVANVDTGVRLEHPALLEHYRGNLGASQFDNNYNWFDPQRFYTEPTDDNGHGTHTMGTIAGEGDTSGDHPRIGVAPDASWIAAQGCENYFCSDSDLIAAAQWIIAPTRLDGANPRPDLRPMIVNNSWGGLSGDDWYAGYTTAWRAAGIFPVFAAGNASGNQPQACGSVGSPGDYSNVVAVGASDHQDKIAGFSLLGPARNGRLKPDFTAPGTYQSGVQGILSAAIDENTNYRTLQGTSMATPHIAGTVALLWAANPALIGDYDATYEILRATASPISDTRCGDQPGAPNNVYGWGRIDAYAAVARARVDVPWLRVPTDLPAMGANDTASLNFTLDASRVPGPGKYAARVQIYGNDLSQSPTTIVVNLTVVAAPQQMVIKGRVTRASSVQPLAAKVGVPGSLATATDATGAYTLTLALPAPTGGYELVANAATHFPLTQTVTLEKNQRINFALTPDLPQMVIATTDFSRTLSLGQHQDLVLPISNTGTQPLYYSLHVPPDGFSVWRSDESGGPKYKWIELPSDAPRLDFSKQPITSPIPLGFNFPFQSLSITETLVTAQGTLGFAEIPGYKGITQGCLPDTDLYFYLIAPFRADLDPTRGGSVRYATLQNPRAFVLTYDHVPLTTGSTASNYTFQAILYQDGRITFQYKSLAQLPNRVSAGVQRVFNDYISLGCGPSLPVKNGLAVEFRPQPPATLWLESSATDGAIEPGKQIDVPVRLTWVRPLTPGPYHARIIINSSDPEQAQVTKEVQLTPLPASHELSFPIMGNDAR